MSKLEYRDWFDEVDLMHLNRNPDMGNSENGPLFTAEFHTLYAKVYGKKHSLLSNSINAVNPNPGIYKPSGNGGEHFSHDNMSGLYCMWYLYSGKCPKHLAITTKYVKHPRDILFFLYAKMAHKTNIFYKFLQHMLLIIPAIAMIVSCYQTYKVRNGNKILKTDGKLLTWLRCETFGLTKTLAVCEWILKKRNIWYNWSHIFIYYFKTEGHPNNEMSEKIYKGKGF